MNNLLSLLWSANIFIYDSLYQQLLSYCAHISFFLFLQLLCNAEVLNLTPSCVRPFIDEGSGFMTRHRTTWTNRIIESSMNVLIIKKKTVGIILAHFLSRTHFKHIWIDLRENFRVYQCRYPRDLVENRLFKTRYRKKKKRNLC